jgi:hypothetical protein
LTSADPDESLNRGSRCIADAQPDDFWWRTVHQRQAPKIIVLGDHAEIMLARIGPDLQISETRAKGAWHAGKQV